MLCWKWSTVPLDHLQPCFSCFELELSTKLKRIALGTPRWRTHGPRLTLPHLAGVVAPRTRHCYDTHPLTAQYTPLSLPHSSAPAHHTQGYPNQTILTTRRLSSPSMLRSLRLTRPLAAKHLRACSLSSKPKKAAPSLGVVRLDYDYPPALGDIDHPGSYAYDVFYRAVPGLTFAMCQNAVPKTGTPLPDDVMKGFVEAIKYLDQDKNVSGSAARASNARLAIAHISVSAAFALSLSWMPHASHASPLPTRARSHRRLRFLLQPAGRGPQAHQEAGLHVVAVRGALCRRRLRQG